MRKLLSTVASILFFTAAFSQNANWYISVSTGAGWGGPKGSLKNKFEKTGYNQTANSNFFGWQSTVKYPHVTPGLPLMIRAGKNLKGNKSIYFMAGTSAANEVEGFKKSGYGSFFGLFAGDVGTTVSIKYKIRMAAAGMEYAMPNSKLKLGCAAGLFIMQYHNMYSTDAGKKALVLPGLALTARQPLGKEKRRVGVELVVDVNVAASATIKDQYHSLADNNGFYKEVNVFTATKVSMVHGMAGLALTYRKK